MIRQLCMDFLDADDDAKAWGAEPHEYDSYGELPDCDVMSKRFVEFARDRGFPARLVKVELDAAFDGLGGGPHWFAVIDGVAFDWTARQFYDVKGVNLAFDEIPSPLLFLWPGPYPIPSIEAEEVSW